MHNANCHKTPVFCEWNGGGNAEVLSVAVMVGVRDRPTKDNHQECTRDVLERSENNNYASLYYFYRIHAAFLTSSGPYLILRTNNTCLHMITCRPLYPPRNL